MIEFWNEKNPSDNSCPYNSLKLAWRNDSGEKRLAFNHLWSYFQETTSHTNMTKVIKDISTIQRLLTSINYNSNGRAIEDEGLKKIIEYRDKTITNYLKL
jgi:hypothetical protein